MPIGNIAARSPWRIASGAGSILATAGQQDLAARCPRVAALLPQLAEALAAHASTMAGRLFDLTDFSADETALIGEVLGEGEVSGMAALPDGIVAQVQESVLAGLWRVRFQGPGGGCVADYLEVAAVPEAVCRAALLTRTGLEVGVPPEGTMNVLPVLAEIRDHAARHQPGAPPHVINFTLLPMTEADMGFLQASLGEGPVMLFSRGYGACRVVATGLRHVWSVQYFNTAGVVVLDTLEIGDVPEAVLAATEDFRESATRLLEMAEACFA
ncbi:Hydrogenase expression/formation protein HupH [Rhodovastum atsumiense]|uniref:Hydrogenase expression/formation protein n=1 Tax=Rhodovastum atsumiense TaxID=504468 RepID=A0A5M6IN41_9PROT|nr:hydrogenase expression/formation protein [Rhodovastum atsumiense]KAA5608935.1 hydrogenase expression/formation protein [Rhodovastum atsumiense]CAH2604209.1 Hydrogenase expression/formation protein HupH [Rhodovastum atsumiense]